jgi:hypothetical protein
LGKLEVRKVVQVPSEPEDADKPLHHELRRLAAEHGLLKTGRSEFHHLPLLFDAEKLMDHASSAAVPASSAAVPASSAAEPLKKTTKTLEKKVMLEQVQVQVFPMMQWQNFADSNLKLKLK